MSVLLFHSILDQVTVNREHIQTDASNMIETREKRPLQIADITSDICRISTIETNVEYDVLLPAGTNINFVKVEYWRGNDWVEASCGYSSGDNNFVCVASYPNPLVGNIYNIRTTINNNDEFFGSYISLENKCIYFD